MTEKPQSSISMDLFSDVPFFSKMSQPPGMNQQFGRYCYLPPISFRISFNDTFFHFPLKSLGFYLSPKCEKKFSIYGVHITRNCIQSAHFYSCLSYPLETPRKFFCKSVSHQDESGGGEYDLLY